MKLKIATYNIWHGQNYAVAELRGKFALVPENFASFFVKQNADICGMQEVDVYCTRTAGQHQPFEIAKEMERQTGTPYQWAFAAGLDGALSCRPFGVGYDAANPGPDGWDTVEKSGYGNAILSRFPILEVKNYKVAAHEVTEDPKTQAIRGGWEQRAVCRTKIDVNGKIITVATTHFGLNAEERDKMIEVLRDEVLADVDTPVILMGDFNSFVDSTHIAQLDALVVGGKKLIRAGKEDMTPTCGTVRIDYIYYTEDLTESHYTVHETELDSDHVPVTVELELK